MAGDLRVAGRMAIRGTVAAMRTAACLAGSKMNPTVACFYAFVALQATCGFHFSHRCKVFTRSRLHTILLVRVPAPVGVPALEV